MKSLKSLFPSDKSIPFFAFRVLNFIGAIATLHPLRLEARS